MKFHDPKRPFINNLPALLSQSGQPIAPLPGLVLRPIPETETGIEIGCFLINGYLSASYYSFDANWDEIPMLLHSWNYNPEQFLAVYMKYTYEPKAPHLRKLSNDPPTRPQLNLEDLGL